MNLTEMKSYFFLKYKTKQIEKSHKKISEWIKYEPAFLLSQLKGEKYKMLSEKKFFNELSNINLLTLELTQNCNLRCKYCVFGGSYQYYRKHNTKKMSWAIAKRAIDYYFNIIFNSKVAYYPEINIEHKSLKRLRRIKYIIFSRESKYFI